MFKRKKQASVNTENLTPISRVKTLKGVYVPAIIDNMSYFYTKLQVYEDGLVDAWELLDLDLFQRKLQSGKVKVTIPDGEDISIHHLGAWEVTQGQWNFDVRTFFDYIVSVVKSLNPEMQNLHNCHGQTTKKLGNINTSILGMGNGKPYTLEGHEYFPKKTIGDDFSVFIKTDEDCYSLANLCVFTNGSLQASGIAEILTFDLDELKSLVSDEKIITTPKAGSKITIHELGSFITGKCRYSVDIKEVVLEVEETLKKLQGKKTASELCYQLYQEFCESPTEEIKEQLKAAYEKIPEHLRMYVLGDQDRKDIPVRIAIYGEDEIKKWSHYAIAEELGEELPSIDAPKPSRD